MKTENSDKAFILDFIEVYRQLPALWDSRTKEYNNRSERDKQYKILLQKYRERYPKANKAQMAKHINSLRTGFRRERRRLEQLSRNGAVCIKPTGWYYNALSFIQDVSRTSMHFKDSCIKQEAEAAHYQIPFEREITDAEPYSEPQPYKQSRKRELAAADVELNREAAPHHKRRKHIAAADDELNRLAVKTLPEPFDDFQQISDLWAVKLRKMQPLQQILAEKFINDILLEGQLGALHRHSMQLNTTRSMSASPDSLEYTLPRAASANNTVAFETIKQEEYSNYSASDLT